MKKVGQQSGQALLELAICSIGLLTVMLAVIFFGGYALSNVRILLSAKQNAEIIANNSSKGGAGANIGRWNFGEVPFTAQDSHNNALETNEIFSFGHRDGNYSNAAHDQYIFMDPANLGKIFTTSNRNYQLPDYAVGAANLIRGINSGNHDDPALLKSGKIINARELKKIKLTFFNLIKVDLDEHKLSDIPANQVYMPAMGE